MNLILGLPAVKEEHMPKIVRLHKKGFDARAVWILTVESGVVVCRWVQSRSALDQLKAMGVLEDPSFPQAILDALAVTGAKPSPG